MDLIAECCYRKTNCVYLRSLMKWVITMKQILKMNGNTAVGFLFKTVVIYILITFLSSVYAKASPQNPRECSVNGATFEQRCDEITEHILAQPIHPDWHKLSDGKAASGLLKWHINPIAARLFENAERAEVTKLYLRALSLCDNTRDAPWSTTRSLWTTLTAEDTLPPKAMELQKELLQRWNYNCSAGTVNMRLYLYVAGFLASEQWKDFRDAEEPVDTSYAVDFRGKTVSSKSANEIHRFCKKNIYEIFRQFTVENHVEHAQVYFMCDVEAIKMLAEFAKDPDMKKRAEMVMDYFLLNLATDWNQGYQAEPYFRNKYYSVLMQSGGMTHTRALGWLYFGSPRSETFKDLPMLFTRGEYRMPPVFEAIANDRDGIRKKRESHWFKSKPEAVVRKTFFHTPSYSLTSAVSDYRADKGIKTALFKEQRMLNLVWVSEKSCSRFYVFQENYKQPYFGRTAPNHFGSGENPYSDRLQHQRTAIGVYDVPESYEFYRQYTTYPKSGAVKKQMEKNNWVFSHTGNMLFAFYSLKPTVWQRDTEREGVAYPVDVRWCDSRKNGWVLETADASRYTGTIEEQMTAFIEDVLENGLVDGSKMNKDSPEFSYKTIYGDTLTLRLAGLGQSPQRRHFINGKGVDYNSWMMLDSPWASQPYHSSVLKVDFAGVELTYDFENWTVSGDRMAKPELP